MEIEMILTLIGVIIVILSNIVAFVVLISKLGIRVKFCEDSIKVLFSNDKLHSDEIKVLYEIKGQLELLISQNNNKN